MGRTKGAINKNKIKYNIFLGVKISQKQSDWLYKYAYYEKTKISKLIRKMIDEYIFSEKVKKQFKKRKINIKQINNEENLLEIIGDNKNEN